MPGMTRGRPGRRKAKAPHQPADPPAAVKWKDKKRKKKRKGTREKKRLHQFTMSNKGPIILHEHISNNLNYNYN